MLWLIIPAALALSAGLGLVYYAAYVVRSQLLGPTIWRGDHTGTAVALTFDDGPSESTDAILDILKSYDVKATFFVVGNNLQKFPATARRMIAEGHEIGNHSLTHPIFLYQRASSVTRELLETQRAIRDVVGVDARFSRPPCGVRTPRYFRTARALGLTTVQWDVTGFDWQDITPAEIAGNTLKHLGPGAIVLLHDGDHTGRTDRSRTAQALPAVIEGIKGRGLDIVPLQDLIARPA